MLKGQFRIISIRISVSKGYWLKTDQLFSVSKTYKLSFWLKYREKTINFIVWSKLSSCQNWEIISNRNIVVLQCVVLASSLFLRLIHNHIYNIQDKCKNELSLYLKTKKTYMAKSHRRLAKELMIIFFPLFFSFGIGFVIVLDPTKAKRLSGMTYHNNEVFCNCLIHVSVWHCFVTVTR